MFELNLPPFDIKTKMIQNKPFIWDALRKKYVALTPEEWVRQHFINYLVSEKKYPQTLIANEMQIILNNQKKRCDSVVYNNNLKPVVIIEYKAPDVRITQHVFDQIARYNIILKVPFLIVSNGMEHYCCRIDYENQTFSYMKEIPDFDDIESQKRLL